MIIYAICQYAEAPLVGVQLMIAISLSVLIYQVHERVWTYSKINWQSILNESLLCGVISLMLASRLNSQAV